jgi:hypothetical protein
MAKGSIEELVFWFGIRLTHAEKLAEDSCFFVG